MSLSDLLQQNRKWAAEQLKTSPDFFSRQLAGQKPRLLWIGCSDSRVPAEQILGCGPGELFIHRNVANIVAFNDINISAVIQYATRHLMVPDIVVCGHYGCGGVQAACERKAVQNYIRDWLNIAEGALRLVEGRLVQEGSTVPKDELLRLVIEENVRLQIRHLRDLSVLRDCWEATPGVPRLHGWVYDMSNGLIKVLEANA